MEASIWKLWFLDSAPIVKLTPKMVGLLAKFILSFDLPIPIKNSDLDLFSI